MREITGDLFSHNRHGPDAICITTNGYVGKDGCNVMGMGSAGEAKKRYPGIEKRLGVLLENEGNQVHLLTQIADGQIHLAGIYAPYHIVSFPTKPRVVNESDELLPRYRKAHEGHLEDLNLPGWMSQSRIDLIYQSAVELQKLATEREWKSIVLPRPGCGAGGLEWTDVKPVLENVLDDRFYVITKG